MANAWSLPPSVCSIAVRQLEGERREHQRRPRPAQALPPAEEQDHDSEQGQNQGGAEDELAPLVGALGEDHQPRREQQRQRAERVGPADALREQVAAGVKQVGDERHNQEAVGVIRLGRPERDQVADGAGEPEQDREQGDAEGELPAAVVDDGFTQRGGRHRRLGVQAAGYFRARPPIPQGRFGFARISRMSWSLALPRLTLERIPP